MAVVAIVRPLPIYNIGGTFEGGARLLTPDPKEAAITAGGARTIDVDLGSVQSFDTIFLGYTSGGGGALAVTAGAGSYTTTALAELPLAHSDLIAPRPHYVRVYDAPTSARYVRITGTFPANFAIGVLVIGLAFRPTWGHEYGAGRFVEDTSSVERLFGGGFGIDPGTITGGWQWTFGDLQPDELRKLWALARSVGESRSVLVVEDTDQTEGLSDRCHWGLFRKLDAYERVNPKDTRWSFQIGDWA